MQNKLRIIGGAWRSRNITFSDAPGLRPTPARVRETLFNWLHYDIAGKTCLDLYAGSGALGFEAASRGAKSVVLVESNAQVCLSLKNNVAMLSAQQISIAQTEVSRFLAATAQGFDVVFIDPPFTKDLVPTTCLTLENNGWLNPHAKIYIETERSLTLSGLPANWQVLKHKTAGEVAYQLFERG
ncbi:16S rRNA (guanine(966)-N(2))-methyltransferase RsmD [Crenothrix polyspora]|uniref:Ribosomal RNA small subunit methyltransferase D n=1 Tax=Crenothrix polyspora TaxID=360316 RepID=A0A1R4H7S7_9GAMM|nr:16S rRNA (guanine(966)-N(2))-methyltransferase RsmD [Crenothrix polyspora]SJM92236.1 Ribosomal RNA small subunit methyltransferase D [Crenothrix polyspora]